MAFLDAGSSVLDIGVLDTLACRNTPIHRLDARVKLLTTLLFVGTVVSFDRYTLSALLPFLAYPVFLVSLGNIPLRTIFEKLLAAMPFALFVGLFNPLLDQGVIAHIGSLGVSGGWISFASILLRFGLTVSAALLLIATTGFHAVCLALQKLGAPRVLSSLLLFLYRYLFVLGEETTRMARARALRSFGGRGMGIHVFGSMAGNLLLRTLDRAQRIHQAMLCRGYAGAINLLRPLTLRKVDGVFLAGWSVLFLIMRWVDVPQAMGHLVTALFT